MEYGYNSNWFAYVALCSWPIVSFLLYRRFSVTRATLLSIICAYLLLPVRTQIDLPMIPPLDKSSVPNLAAFFVCRFVLGKKIDFFPKILLVRVLLLIYIISPFVTALLNPDPVIAGQVYIKAMDSYDALSAVIRQMLFILPFLLGMAFFRDQTSHEEFLLIIIISALFYSLPMLFEVRMSPQLHRWIYGYFPHSFVQQMRAEGFRPVVFLGHGLLVAFYTACAVIAAGSYWILRKSIFGFRSGVITAYLGGILILCKSLAATIYAILAILMLKTTSPIFQLRMAKFLVILVVLYPLSRAADWFPTQALENVAADFSELRAQSLKFRLDNEEILLNKALQKPFFGWGTWGRNRVYDHETGKDLSITDGRWVIVMGEFGWFGYLAEFGLLALPVFRSAAVIRKMQDKREKVVLSGMAILMAVSMVDLLPNASVAPLTWLLAGALIGRCEYFKKQDGKQFARTKRAYAPMVRQAL